jgi:hypothetical protein
MARVEAPGDGPPVRRRSLSAEQIRDPLGTLATAYGVPPDLSDVAAAISKRLPADLVPGGWEASFPPVAGIVFVVLRDGRNLGRIYRGSPLAKTARMTIKPSLNFYVGSDAADGFVETVCAEIRSALG